MTSLFTRFVAQGVEVPVTDPRLLTHVDICEVVPADEGQATTEEVQAPSVQRNNSTEVAS